MAMLLAIAMWSQSRPLVPQRMRPTSTILRHATPWPSLPDVPAPRTRLALGLPPMQHALVTPDDAAAEVRSAASQFGSGETDIHAMWSALHRNLRDLCAEAPLQGDFLELFNALQRWEAASGVDRSAAVVLAQAIAQRLGAA